MTTFKFASKEELVRYLRMQSQQFIERAKRDKVKHERQYNRGTSYGLMMAADIIEGSNVQIPVEMSNQEIAEAIMKDIVKVGELPE